MKLRETQPYHGMRMHDDGKKVSTMKINFRLVTATSRARCSRINVEHVITLQLVRAFLCRILVDVYIGDNGPEWERCREIKSRMRIDEAIRERLKWYGNSFADCWQDDVRASGDRDTEFATGVIEEKAESLIAAFYPEFASEIAASKNSA